MSKEQRDAIDAVLRAAPFDLEQGTEESRKTFDGFALRPYPADVRAAEADLGGVGAIELTVEGQATGDPVRSVDVLYFHGGGYVAGSARNGTHLAAYAGLLESGARPGRVVLAGDSAGGGLAVATLLAARERGLPQPAAVAVFSPWADISRSGASMRTKDGIDPLFSYAALGWYADKYIPDGDRSAPLASPVFATLAGLPPLLIQVGSHEVLLDDAVRLAAAAGLADVDVTLRVAPEGTHVFQLYFGALDEADEALDEVARFFRRHLG